MKIVLAGMLGGIVMFIWTSIAHMFLPLGEAGLGEISNESAVLSAMQSNIGEQTGLYIFPGPGVGKDATRQEKSEAMKHMGEKMAANPSGILMYHAPGRPFTFGKWLGVEFGTELLEAILVVFLLAQTRLASFVGRVGFVLVAGILAAIATNVSYWNWYGFPCVYTAGYMFIQIIGFLCVGIVAALVLRKRCPVA
jgi:uncharacterized membrane protein YkgB